MRRDEQGPVLWDARVQRLIKNLPPAATLSPAQLDRIERAVGGDAPRARSKLPVFALAAAIVVVAAALSLRHRPKPAEPSLTVPAGAVTTLERRGARFVVLGPATLGDLDATALRVFAGKVFVRSGDQTALVAVPEGSVNIGTKAKIVIDVRSGHTRVASYEGSAHVQWIEFGREVEIGDGTQLDAAGVTLAPAAERSEFESTTSQKATIEGPSAPPAPIVAEPRSPTAARTTRQKPAERVVDQYPEPTAPAAPTEAELVGNAIRALHAGHPEEALAALNDYRLEHPSGKLSPEAETATIEALLALDRYADALARLDRMTLDSLSNRERLLVVRGELRARSRRCQEAIGDFTQALDEADPTLLARAQYGRGVCRATLGDTAGGRTDLESAASADPSGKWGDAARRALRR